MQAPPPTQAPTGVPTAPVAETSEVGTIPNGMSPTPCVSEPGPSSPKVETSGKEVTDPVLPAAKQSSYAKGLTDRLLEESRLSPTNNGFKHANSSVDDYGTNSGLMIGGVNPSAVNKSNILGGIGDQVTANEVSSGQKWWAAIILGFIFAIISSPPAYLLTSRVVTGAGGSQMTRGQGPTIPGLILHTVIFIIIVRLIMW